MKSTSLLDAKRLVDAVQSVGGAVPDVLQSLLLAHDVLSRTEAAEPPEKAILTHALDGTLTAAVLGKLLPAAAAQQQQTAYRQELAARSENHLVGQWHREMEHAADEILASLRPKFDEHAQAIAAARAVINPESAPEHILASAEPSVIRAWRQLDSHLRVVNTIAAIASQFGPRGNYPQISEYNLGDQHPEDRAIMCSDGPLLADSAVFRRPDQGHRTSPWFQVPLKLHSIASATDRYRQWTADEFDRVHSGPTESWIDEQGNAHQKPKPRNPFREKAAAT